MTAINVILQRDAVDPVTDATVFGNSAQLSATHADSLERQIATAYLDSIYVDNSRFRRI